MKHYHKNPRQITKKQFADLQLSLAKLGDLSGIVHDLTTDEVIGGNQRMEVFDINAAQIEIVERFPEPDDQGTVATGWVHWHGHRYTYRAVMWDDKTRAEANIRANKAGGSFDFDTLANEFELEDLLEWGFSEFELGLTVSHEVEAKKEENEFRDTARGVGSRTKPKTTIDLIWTQTSTGCCTAIRMGWLYGIQSGSSVCPCAEKRNEHKVVFVDNDFKLYDHQKHLEVVKRFEPKYCTVRDIMTKKQCEMAGIEYFTFEQILSWADELSQYSEKVIVIPKYDCLDRIPKKFMLGYSVPTSYGGTPLPIKLFSGWSVHLLGGNPDMQIKYYQEISDSVVSLDNNQIHLKAEFGNTWTKNGYQHINKLPGYEDMPTGLGLWPSVVLSQASFASYFYGGNGQPAEMDKTDE